MKRILSAFLAIVMVLSCLPNFSLDVLAEDTRGVAENFEESTSDANEELYPSDAEPETTVPDVDFPTETTAPLEPDPESSVPETTPTTVETEPVETIPEVTAEVTEPVGSISTTTEHTNSNAMGAAAFGESCGDTLTWSFDLSTGTLTISGNGKMYDYESLEDVPWDEYRDSITKIALSEELTRIGKNAFAKCTTLNSITVPDNVSSIAMNAFVSCTNLTDVDLGDGCNIGEQAFYLCSIENLNLGKSSYFGHHAFAGSAVTSITIDADAPNFGEGAFADCKSLTSVHFTGSAPDDVIDNHYVSSRASFPDVIWYYDCSKSGWTTSSRYNMSEKTWAGYSLISETHAEVTDPGIDATCTTDGLTKGSHCAVCGEILVPQTVIPAIGNHSFVGSSCEYCKLIGGTCGETAVWTFDANTKALTISGSGAVTSNPWMDGYSTAYTLVIEEGITELCDHAFRHMPKLNSVQLPSTLTAIPSYCFYYSSEITQINIPEGIESIGEYALCGLGITSLTIPDSVTSDLSDFLSGCANLKEVVIGSGVSSITVDSEHDMHNLFAVTDYIVSENNPYYASLDGAIYSKDFKTLIKYPDGRSGTVDIPAGVESINAYAFYYAQKITEINIPASVKTITENSFGSFLIWNAKALENIHVDENNTAFSSEDGLLYNKAKTVLLSCGPAKKGSVTIPDGVWEIGTRAFHKCSELEEIHIPNSVEAVNFCAFEGCSKLKFLVIPGNVSSWQQFAFKGCSSLQWISFGVKNCSFSQDFDGCYSLEDVYYYGTEEDWNTITISSYDTPVKNAVKHYNAPLPGTWNINYVLNGGDNSVNNPATYFNYGESITLEEPVQNGYIFNGWYLDADATVLAEAPQIQRGSGSGEITFYASWDKLIYSVVLDPAGGTVYGDITEYAPGTVVTLPENVMRSGYIFQGWYEGDTLVTEIPADAAGDKYYTARWQEKAYPEFKYETQYAAYDGTGKEFILMDRDGNILPTVNNSFGQAWFVPTDYTHVILHFGEHTTENGASTNHLGIDLAAPEGMPIYASRDGWISQADFTASGGNMLKIQHNDGYSSIYMHMYDICVAKGQYVSQGDLIGHVGSTGIVSESHLHFGIQLDGEYVNPAKYVSFDNGFNVFYIDYSFTDLPLDESGLPFEPGIYQVHIERPESATHHRVSYGIGGALEISDQLHDGIGDHLVWEFDEDSGKLTISGTGSMRWFNYDYETGETDAPWYSFKDAIRSVVIEEGVTNISHRAFAGCTNLQTLSISSTVDDIVSNTALTGCISMTAITVASGNENYCAAGGVLFDKDQTSLIKYPARKSGTLYKVPDTVTTIEPRAFEDAASLRKIGLPAGLELIWGYAFAGCSSLTSMEIPNGITSLYGSLFQDCISLETVVLPNIVTSIDHDVFNGCTSLKSISLSDNLSVIWENAFRGCTSLTEIRIPASVQELGQWAFADCTSLKRIIFEGDAPSFNGDDIFEGTTTTAVYPYRDGSWTEDVRKDYRGTVTWKPMATSLTIGRNNHRAIAVGDTVTLRGQKQPHEAEIDLTFTVTGSGSLLSVDGAEASLKASSAGNITVTAVDGISGLRAELTLPVVTATPITCPGVSDPFTITEGTSTVFTFTPAETKRYSMTLENVTNPTHGYGMLTYITVTDSTTGTVVTDDESVWEESTTQGFFTLTEGVPYRIETGYHGTEVHKDVILRLSEVAAVTGIEIPENTMICYYDPDAGIDRLGISAFFRPVQAFGDITWTSSDPSVLAVDYKHLHSCEVVAKSYGTAVITATCGDYSDSVTVTVTEMPRLTIDVPYPDVAVLHQENHYVFTAPEDGLYRFRCSEPILISASGSMYDEEQISYTRLKAGESCTVVVLNLQENRPQIPYTIMAKKVVAPTTMTLTPSLTDDGEIRVTATYAPEGAFDLFDIVDWDNDTVTGGACSWHGNTTDADIRGTGEVTITILTESGLMEACTVAAGTCGRNLFWMFEPATGKLTISGSGAMYDYDYCRTPWKDYAEQITSVSLPDTLTALGAYAFNGCLNLSEITLPEGITAIPDYAFNRCESLTELIIPDSVKVIGDTAFSECNSLTYLALPDGLETIKNSAFSWNSGLKDIQLPENLDYLGGAAFGNCTALETINIPDSLEVINWSTFNGCTSLKEITIPKSVTEISYHVFSGCSSLNTVIFEGSAPSTGGTTNDIWWQPFLGVYANAWYPGNDTSWTQDAMDKMGTGLWWRPYYGDMYSGTCGDNLTWSFDEPTGTLTISGTGAMDDFEYNTVPWGIHEDDILTVLLPEGITSIGTNAFGGCFYLSSINLPEGLTHIGDHAFEECHSLTKLDMPSSLKYIGVYTFCASALTELNLPESLETIDMYAFMGCHNLTEVTLPKSLKTLGGGAFQNCNNLHTADLPETLDVISWHTFNECTNLKEVTIPKTVTEISYFAFNSCTGMETVTFEGSAPSIDTGLFGDAYPFNNVSSDAYYPGDDATWTDSAKQSMGGDLNWIASEKFNLTGITATFGDSLAMNFVVNTANLEGTDNYAVITKNYADGSVVEVTVDQSDWKVYSGSLYYFSFNGIAAKEMMDSITAVVYNGNDQQVTYDYETSLQDYCVRAWNKESQKASPDTDKLTQYIDMLYYGAAAQVKFGYDTGNLANAGLTEAQKAYATPDSAVMLDDVYVKGTGCAGITLTLVSQIELNFVFENTTIDQANYAIATFTDHYGNAKEVRIETFPDYGTTRKYVPVTGMSAADCGQSVTLNLYDSEGNVLSTCVESVTSMCSRATSSNALYWACLKYCQASYKYFH